MAKLSHRLHALFLTSHLNQRASHDHFYAAFQQATITNKVKLALLEKGVPFQESEVWTSEVDTRASPLGKVPYLLTPSGALCESTVMLDYIEQQYPAHPLVPADPFQAAKVRELATYIDLHLSWSRETYTERRFLAAR